MRSSMTPVASGLDAATVVAAIAQVEITHIVTVPDTHQRTVLEHLDADDARPVVRAATEHDVFGICVGLWMAGQRPLAVIQQLGLFAAANALRWAHHDARAPLAILAGLFGRHVDVAVDEDSASAVRLCPPLLDALEVPFVVIDDPADSGRIAAMLGSAFQGGGARVVLLGAPTR
jgi:sulfopyruvate decarboxylase TPP-binding subunit